MTNARAGLAALLVALILAAQVSGAQAQSFAEDAQAAAAKALEAGDVGSNEVVASQGMDREIVVAQKVRAIQNKAALQRELEARKKIEGIKANLMQKQLIDISTKIKWSKVGGAAYDIGANNSTWVIGTNKGWVQVPSKARNITVAGNGAPWVVNRNQAIFGWQDAPKRRPGPRSAGRGVC